MIIVHLKMKVMYPTQLRIMKITQLKIMNHSIILMNTLMIHVTALLKAGITFITLLHQ